jgi:hypothetical protein
MRDHLVTQKLSLENHISGVLKPFGIIIERGAVSGDTFYKRTLEALTQAERNGVTSRDMCCPPFISTWRRLPGSRR